MSKTSQLTELTTGLAQNDILQVVDVSDLNMATSGTNKKITIGDLATGLGNSGTLQATIPAGTTGQYWRGDKTWQALNKTTIGLSNVDNESKVTMFTNPTFTGTVTLPNTTSIGSISDVELGYLDGVTSSIQTQLNGKQATISGAATTIVTGNLTASRALVSDSSGKVATSTNVTSTELDYLDGVTSAIQTQLDGKANNSITATGSTAARSLANRFADVVNVKDFGAVGDGVTDDTAAFQTAANASLHIFIPTGSYKITSQILCQTATNIIGSGRSSTTIIASGTSDVFVWQSSGFLTGAGIFNLSINGTAKAGGNCIKAVKVARFNVRNISIIGGYNGIYIEGQNVASIQNTWISGLIGQYAIKNYGSASTRADVLDIDDVQIGFGTNTASSPNGIVIDSNIDTVDIRHVGIVKGYRGLSIVNTDGIASSPSFVTAYDLQTDFTYAEGILIDGGTGVTRTHQFTDCYIQGSLSECGIKISESASYVSIKSGQISGNFKQGIIVNGRYTKIIGCQIATNSIAGSALYPNVEFGSTAYSTGNSLIGCTCGQWIGYASELSSYGLIIRANQDRYTVTGNIFQGNVTGDYLDESNNTASVIFGNAQSTSTRNVIGSPISSQSGQNLSLLGSSTNRVSLGNVSNGVAFQAVAQDSSSVNFLTAVSRATEAPPRIQCDGSDTNIDLRLSPKGTGLVQYGTHAASSDVAITGYIEIKDSSGVTRKLAVIS
jgi:hypothetical protein